MSSSWLHYLPKALVYKRAGVKDPLNYSLGDQKIPEASCCKYLGIIIRSDLSWADQVNYTVQTAWRTDRQIDRRMEMKKVTGVFQEYAKELKNWGS